MKISTVKDINNEILVTKETLHYAQRVKDTVQTSIDVETLADEAASLPMKTSPKRSSAEVHRELDRLRNLIKEHGPASAKFLVEHGAKTYMIANLFTTANGFLRVGRGKRTMWSVVPQNPENLTHLDSVR
jgi:hypothetical protein